ncbi:MAG: hypothetical protein RL701_6454 [Pseudomonadota bacterium]
MLAFSHAVPARSFAQPSAAGATSAAAATSEVEAATDIGASAAGLRGLLNTGSPIAPRELTLRTSVGYGFTEGVGDAPGAEQRLQGALAASMTPLPWLGFGLRVDGRLEFHGDDGMGSHIAGFGDPHLFVRAGHALDARLALAVQLGAWFPGRNAPSLVLGATTIDGQLHAAYRVPHQPAWTLLGSLGGRWDNSAHVAPDPARLRVGDRVSLGLSSSSAVLIAAGAAWQFEPRVQLFGELSADLLVGSGAQTWYTSPLRAALGGRYAFSPSLQGEATAIVALSGRPDIASDRAFIPIEPRFMILLGIAYTLPLPAATAAPESAPESDPEPKLEPEPPKPPPSAAVSGSIVDERGEPLPDVQVVLQTQAGEHIETITDASGQYRFQDLAPGEVQLEAHAVGFKTQSWTSTLASGVAAEPDHKLIPAANIGVLRCLIRSFDSQPLRAQIQVRNKRGAAVQTATSGDDGLVELELAPGRYTIHIEAAGYRKHSQTVQVKGNDVAVLNADLRKSP